MSFFCNLAVNGEITGSGNIVTSVSVHVVISECNEATRNRAATCFFQSENKIHEVSLSTNCHQIGSCVKTCDRMPMLSTVSRGKGIASYLAAISGMDSLVNAATSQYKAAYWLICDDIKHINASSPHVVQRCVIGLLYISTSGPSWTKSNSFLSGEYECDWRSVTYDSDDHTCRLYLCECMKLCLILSTIADF